MFTVPETLEESVTYSLTPQQERVWRQMRSLQSVNGGKPATQGEISKALGLRSKQGCAAHFPALSRLGFIVCTGRHAWRSWLAVDPDPSREVTEYTRGRVKNNEPNHSASGAPLTDAPLARVPIYSGSAANGPTEEEGFTPRQVEVWHAMYSMQQLNSGNPPTQQELSTALGMTSIQGCRNHLVALARKGYTANKRRQWFATVPPHRQIQVSQIPDFTEQD
jgi:SOS-response transcriptional repressor LexA